MLTEVRSDDTCRDELETSGKTPNFRVPRTNLHSSGHIQSIVDRVDDMFRRPREHFRTTKPHKIMGNLACGWESGPMSRNLHYWKTADSVDHRVGLRCRAIRFIYEESKS